MKDLNVKVVFWESGQQAAELVFKAKRNGTGTDIDLTLKTSAENIATYLAKHLEQYLKMRLLMLKAKDTPTARA